MTALPAQHDMDRASRVVRQAILRAADHLQISRSRLAGILGVSPATVSRLARGGSLDPRSKNGEAAMRFLRMYRSLLSLFDGNMGNAIRWLKAENRNFTRPPIEMITTMQGLLHVIEYLDAMRGHE